MSFFCCRSCSLCGFCCGCLGYFGCGSSCLLGRTTCALCLLCGLGHVLVEVNEFDEAHGGCVAGTETGLDDAGVATGTVADLLCYYGEELGDGLLVLEVAEDYAAGVGGVFID